MTSEIRAVLFDLDNTLTISEDFAAEVLSAAALQHGHEIHADVILCYPGAVYVPLLQELTGMHESTAREIYRTYADSYVSMMPGRLLPTLGAEPLIAALAARGIPLALVTNKPHALASAVLELFGWTSAFAIVVGNDSTANHKPHPEPALAALTALGCTAEQAAFVGDAAGDMQCGRSAGIATLIALVGTTGHAELQSAGATHLCHTLHEVLDVLIPDVARRDAELAT